MKPKNNNIATGEALPIMEVFYSIQGEGFHSGQAAIFIRIGGCDVGCHWCDVKESWNPKIHPASWCKDVLNDIASFNCKNVVITGGEPLMYNLKELCIKLKEKKYTIFLETSGAYEGKGSSFDWVCLSPKKNKSPLAEWLQKANELKVIIHNQNDFDYALKISTKVTKNCLLYLQPEWSKYKTIITKIIDFVQCNNNWKISLQNHKFMKIP